MRRRNFALCVSVAVSLAIGAATTGELNAGCYNVPGTFVQCAGCGYGGGYHAPLYIGPPNLIDCFCPNQVRLLHSPSPYGPCACCYQPGQEFEGTSKMRGEVPVAPTPAPQRATVPPGVTAAPVPQPASMPRTVPAPLPPPMPPVEPAPTRAPAATDASGPNAAPMPADVPMPPAEPDAPAAPESPAPPVQESPESSVPPSAVLPIFDAPVQL